MNGDTDVESDETFFVDLTNPADATITDAQGQGTITNDDIPPPTLSISDGTIAEEGAIDVFVSAGAGGLVGPRDLVFGSDGNLYVASADDQVLRYNGTTGAFIDVFVAPGSGGLDSPGGLEFGTDGNLYVISSSDNVLRYQGPGGASPGTFVDEFVTTGNGGLDNPNSIVFGSDGNLYVTSRNTDNVLRFQGPTGGSPGAFIDEYVTAGSGGLDGPTGLVFGPDGNLYVGNATSQSLNNENVFRFQGPNGASPGAFIDEYVTAGDGGLLTPTGLAFGPTGDLHVFSAGTDSVLRFQGPNGASPGAFVYEAAPAGGPGGTRGLVFGSDGNLYVCNPKTHEVQRYSQGLTVTLSLASGFEVSVDFATTDGTATAGSDYAALSRTLTFAPGDTSKKILLAGIDDIALESSETLTVTLSNPIGDAIIGDGTATATITDDDSLRQVTIDDVTVTEGDESPHFRDYFGGGEGGNFFTLTFGPDGNLYAAPGITPNKDAILRYDGTTGVFMDVFIPHGCGGPPSFVLHKITVSLARSRCTGHDQTTYTQDMKLGGPAHQHTAHSLLTLWTQIHTANRISQKLLGQRTPAVAPTTWDEVGGSGSIVGVHNVPWTTNSPYRDPAPLFPEFINRFFSISIPPR